ncbi:Aldo/keto reductase [Ruminococcus sp. YE71]|uniref:aldo/keto reductase n=1 Tax=unclassified Ruminococcus TaxID=2608920 RepID=UPI000884F8A8|nr:MULTISPECIES: aldo/keto reductase [unclassified Ruminococcus]SDA24710.1 Aldo/keto reductase [Ruminococcus sp. YE78]SFW43675.1 Aldo/keto reductase [Ruminococcus sp. YE71]
MDSIKLSNGVSMPMLGFGTFMIKQDCEQHVADALKLGYRLVDTASAYFNEAAVGRAISASGITRGELFVTSKVWVQDAGYDNTLRAFEKTLRELGLDYLDLYLIHQPYGDYYGSWRAMERLMDDGLIRAIGVSNFSPERVVDLALNSDTPPMVDQIELHPFLPQTDAIAEIRKYGCVPQAWGPLCEGQRDIFGNPTLTEIAASHGKTAAQIALKWNLQRGVAVIPRSTNHKHRAENLCLDFTLTDEEMQRITSLDIGHSEIIDHRCAHTARQLINWKIHD